MWRLAARYESWAVSLSANRRSRFVPILQGSGNIPPSRSRRGLRDRYFLHARLLFVVRMNSQVIVHFAGCERTDAQLLLVRAALIHLIGRQVFGLKFV